MAKARRKAKNSTRTRPITISIHGGGLDIDATIDSAIDFGPVLAQLTRRAHPPSVEQPAKAVYDSFTRGELDQLLQAVADEIAKRDAHVSG